MDLPNSEEKTGQLIQSDASARQTVFERRDLPNIYINSFSAGNSISDVYIVLERNGVQIGVLNMSYTCAKSLQSVLHNIMENFEKATDHKILRMEEVAQGLKKADKS